MRKNVAGQKISASLVSKTDGSAVTTGTTTVYVTVDAGTQATTGTATHKGNGEWSYAPSQAETNGGHVAFTFVNASAVGVTVNTYPVSYDPTDAVRLGLTGLANAAAGASGGLALVGSNMGTATSVTGAVGSVTGNVGGNVVGSVGSVTTVSDKAGYALSAAGVDAIWDEPKSGHVTANTYGAYLDAAVSAAGGSTDLSGVEADLAAVKAVTDQIDFTAGNVNAHVVAFEASLDAGDIPTAAEISDQVWADVPTGTPLASIADAVWDEAKSGHVTAGTYGAYLDAAVSGVSSGGVSADEIADAVWEAVPTGTPLASIAAAVRDVSNAAPAANSLGEAVNEAASGGAAPTAAAIADAVWDEAQSGHVTAGTFGSRLDAAVSSRSSYAGGDTAGTTTLLSRLTAPRAVALDNLDAAISTRATPAQVNLEADAALADAGVTPTVMSRLDVAVSTIDGGGATADEVADAVRLELATELGRIDAPVSSRSTYAGADTAGTTTLLSRLTSGRAENLDDLDAPVSSRMATFTYTAPDNATIAAIRADTINLPDDPASESAVTAIYNSTFVVKVVPTQIQRPTSGTAAYRVDLYLYEEDGSMSVPDAPPTVDLTTNDGTSRAARLDATTMVLVEPGHYRVVYTASSSDAAEQLNWRFTVVEDAATTVHGATTLVVDAIAVDFDAASSVKLDELHARLTDGRATNLDNLDATVSSRATPVQVNMQAGLALADVGLTTTVTGRIDAAVSSRSSYAGADTLGTTTLLSRLTAPRAANLDNLDETVSSRGTFSGGAVASVTGNVGGNVVGNVQGSVASVTAVADKSGYALGSTGLDAIPMTLNAAPSSFRDWFVWLTLRFRRTRRNKFTGVITVYGSDGTSVATTQTSTDTVSEETTGVVS